MRKNALCFPYPVPTSLSALRKDQCKYHNVGCVEKMMHKDDEVKNHLLLTKYELINATQELQNTKQSFEQQLALKECDLTHDLMMLMGKSMH